MVPHAEYVDVAGAAHMIAGDSNDVFTDAVIAFLDRCDRPDLDNRPRRVTRVRETGSMTTSQELHDRIVGQNVATRFLANLDRNRDDEVLGWKDPSGEW